MFAVRGALGIDPAAAHSVPEIAEPILAQVMPLPPLCVFLPAALALALDSIFPLTFLRVTFLGLDMGFVIVLVFL